LIQSKKREGKARERGNRRKMITSIHGILEACRADQAIIRVGGFSIRVFAPALTLAQLGEAGTEVSLFTHFHIREDEMSLYGFSGEEEREAFEKLIAINGVGPRMALSILSIMDARTLYKAIADEDQQRLALAPGVGKRMAAKLVLEMKGKLPSLAALGAGAASGYTSGKTQAEVLEALIGLGFSTAQAQAALAKIPQDQGLTLEQQITFALRSFSNT
jgi:Holliday junction DNA helicase RuvA